MRSLLAFAMMLCLAAPVQAQTPVGRIFVVFFQEWSAAIDDPALQVAAQAATLAKANPTQTVVVTGYADPSGSKRANELMSQLRAEMVFDALVAAGVPATSIQRGGNGAIEYALNSQESRRVTIAIGTK
jgi:OOP family OmpA-OmpF porin